MRKLLAAFLLFYCATVLLLWFRLLADEPAVAVSTAPPNTAELDRLHTALRQQVRLQANGQADLRLGEADLNRLAAHLLRQQALPVLLDIDLLEGGADVYFSLDTELPRRWLNGRVRLLQVDNKLEPTAVQLGSLPVPAFLLPTLERLAYNELQRHPAWSTVEQAMAAVERFSLTPDRVEASLVLAQPLRAELASRQGELLFGPAVQRRAHAFATQLQQLAVGRKRMPLEEILPPLFAAARQPSDTGADPIVANRALLLAVTLHSVPPGLLRGFGEADLAALVRSRRIELTLHGRRDLAQHFLISALLASYGDEALATRAGLYKELRDMETRSGFDATDLLADYAGMAFGSLATSRAEWLQQWMAEPRRAEELMPPPTQLSAQQRDSLQAAAVAGDLAALEQAADAEVLPLLLATQLYRDAR